MMFVVTSSVILMEFIMVTIGIFVTSLPFFASIIAVPTYWEAIDAVKLALLFSNSPIDDIEDDFCVAK